MVGARIWNCPTKRGPPKSPASPSARFSRRCFSARSSARRASAATDGKEACFQRRFPAPSRISTYGLCNRLRDRVRQAWHDPTLADPATASSIGWCGKRKPQCFSREPRSGLLASLQPAQMPNHLTRPSRQFRSRSARQKANSTKYKLPRAGIGQITRKSPSWTVSGLSTSTANLIFLLAPIPSGS